MKTLIVKYLPNGDDSKSKKLLDLFLEAVENEVENENISILDLLKNPPPIFNEASIKAYYKRNYENQKLTAEEQELLKANDELVAQLKSCDVLVMCYPMHNFSMPASAKAYLDAIALKGETFEYGKKIMRTKKVLTLFTSNGSYLENDFNNSDSNWKSLSFSTIASLAQANFGFMGFDEIKTIGTSLRDKETEQALLAEVKVKIFNLVKKLYRH
ncbi:MAG: NAD(P)H-dependent oxidoreductase [Rickettsiales bacterium]|nr:NAD(P)H-dependent oxidoreductase [Rickettsiales bacterium]